MARPRRKPILDKVTLYLEPWIHRELKIEAAKGHATLGEIVTEALKGRFVPVWKAPQEKTTP